ncbi:TspO/MBR family protein [Microlunatus flavus]|nr:TspO/MBR family protein [Microlunatus flavus]
MTVARALLKTGPAVAACAVLGSIGTREVNSLWYGTLRKPAVQPPPVAFPVVWTALYSDLAVTSAVALDALPEEERPAYARALAANLVLNAGWCWVAFAGHRLGWAVPTAAVLAASSVDLVRRTAAAEGLAGAALAPYAAWCTFATVLGAALWRANRGRRP